MLSRQILLSETIVYHGAPLHRLRPSDPQLRISRTSFTPTQPGMFIIINVYQLIFMDMLIFRNHVDGTQTTASYTFNRTCAIDKGKLKRIGTHVS